ncbi:hypothetical protein Ae201684_006717 [Aphanomyces euteiches]|uniref:Core-binding (CB) domain-containing protein n=1 Tax=Aphanomyces euteiches TaxID=100861 RepID=A0A6G0XBR7_9STRA|nr:hypothetical protein Ae201684_006717 [Aphanomyces euteiches]
MVPRRHNSFSTINGYRNAIKFLYKERNLIASKEVDETLSDFTKGYKKRVAQLKEEGEIAMVEGKTPMSKEGYVYLGEKAVRQDVKVEQYSGMHCFLLLSWNLMARALSVASVRYDHITWEGDAMVIKFGRMKNDQEGKLCYPKHVFANPKQPAICAVLSLGVLVFTRGSHRSDSSTLVFGAHAKEKFSAWVLRTCQQCENDIAALGISVTDVGTHSFRKGVSTALSSYPGGPQAVSVWLRAGWSLGNVQNRYIFAVPGGDQQCGRAAADMNTTEFATLPPHFNEASTRHPFVQCCPIYLLRSHIIMFGLVKHFTHPIHFFCHEFGRRGFFLGLPNWCTQVSFTIQ